MLGNLSARARLRPWAVAATLSLLASAALAQGAYPSKPVRVIVPLSAGAGSDIAARIVTEALARTTGQTFVVENRPGGGGNIGTAAGAKAPPDGYTLVTAGLGITVVNQFLFSREQMGFDPVADLTPIAMLVKAPFAFATRPGSGLTNMQELIAAAKAKPGSVDIAITSGSTRLSVELVKKTTGAQMQIVQYKTFGQAATDTIGGIVGVSVDTLAALRPFFTSGRLRPLGVTTKTTSPLLPGVPSVAEQGVPGYEVLGYISLYGPKGMAQDQVAFLNREILKILQQPETIKRLADLGFEPGEGSPQAFAAFEQAQRELWGPIIKAAGMKAE